MSFSDEKQYLAPSPALTIQYNNSTSQPRHKTTPYSAPRSKNPGYTPIYATSSRQSLSALITRKSHESHRASNKPAKQTHSIVT